MTRVMAPRCLRRLLTGVLTALAVLIGTRAALALSLDERGEIRLGLRGYTAVRVGSERIGDSDNPLNYPVSGAGHLRQNRYFLQLSYDHDLTRLAKQSLGLLAPFRLLDPSALKYTLEYRFEGETLYDWGPDEYTHQTAALQRFRGDFPNVNIPALNIRATNKLDNRYIEERVDRLRRNARVRNRLFLAYLDFEKGPFFLRVGRQVLAWGETDVFRLLDNINPLDDSFGGFFIALDERRVPIAMARASWQLGSWGPFQDAYIEGFAAQGNKVATNPGIPPGSPWEPGGLAFPNQSVRQILDTPDATQVRGGARLVFTAKDITFNVAHYYTYLDVPGIQFRLPGMKNGSNTASFDNPILAFQRFPRVPITGASMTFPITSLYTIVRSEVAYFRGEPMNRQGKGNSFDSFAPLETGIGTPGTKRLRAFNNTEGGLNPFVYPRFLATGRQEALWGTVLQRDSFNMSIGFDINRFIRQLNPTQTFFISTQLFYKHIFNAPDDIALPVPFRNLPVDPRIAIIGNPTDPENALGALGGGCGPKDKTSTAKPRPGTRACNLQPRLFPLQRDRFLQTLLITTSYSGGRIVPFLGMFYDWVGGVVVQPGVTLVRDPFRFTMDYTSVTSVAAQQFGTVRDRDNIRFQVEYVF
jgi:Protein of unknown function (DUF1302)